MPAVPTDHQVQFQTQTTPAIEIVVHEIAHQLQCLPAGHFSAP
jgi:hypothetical protein